MRLLRSRSLTLDQLCSRVGGSPREVAAAAAELRLEEAVILRNGHYSAIRHRYAVSCINPVKRNV
jgi:hypothetical protein